MSMPTGSPPPKRQALRRYPALAFLAIAAILGVTLPSALTVPNTGPPTLAEFAPVPGQGQDAGGDLGRLGSGSSGGLGSGSGDGGVGSLPPLDPGQPPSSYTRCVGDPPRQTEDPLSPPCVAFFEGDNGGATTRGVTRDEITVVFYWGPRGDNQGGEGFEDYDEPIDSDDSTNTIIGKVYARYFQNRYQTYGRHLHVYGFYTRLVTGTAENRAAIRAGIQELDESKRPFAVLGMDGPSATVVATEASKRGLVVATKRGFKRSFYRSVAPYLFSFEPDLDDTAAMATSYLCRRLSALPARFSGNVDDQERTRKFGILYTDSPEDPTDKQITKMIVEQAKRRCGEVIVEAAAIGSGTATWDDYPTLLAQLRQQGVTTVIPLTKGGDSVFWQQSASRIAWFPEWFFVRSSSSAQGTDDTTSARTSSAQEQWSHAFGISHDYRRARIPEQAWYQAFVEACPDCTVPNTYFVPRVYETMLMFMYGVQAAGPRLMAETLDRGLHGLPKRVSSNPAVPATYFEPGNYSFVKDAKEMWWDPQGQPPGESRPGCYRLPRAGNRQRMDWPRGDDGLFERGGQPCQGAAQL